MGSVSYAVYIPASVYYADQIMDEAHKVQGQALMTVAFTIGSVFGNLLGGRLIDWYGVRAMLAVGIVCTAVGTLLFWAGTGRGKKEGKEAEV